MAEHHDSASVLPMGHASSALLTWTASHGAADYGHDPIAGELNITGYVLGLTPHAHRVSVVAGVGARAAAGLSGVARHVPTFDGRRLPGTTQQSYMPVNDLPVGEHRLTVQAVVNLSALTADSGDAGRLREAVDALRTVFGDTRRP